MIGSINKNPYMIQITTSAGAGEIAGEIAEDFLLDPQGTEEESGMMELIK